MTVNYPGRIKSPKFQKRHYEAMADQIKKSFANGLPSDEHRLLFNTCKIIVAELFESDNPKFDRGKFEERCEP